MSPFDRAFQAEIQHAIPGHNLIVTTEHITVHVMHHAWAGRLETHFRGLTREELYKLRDAITAHLEPDAETVAARKEQAAAMAGGGK